jgi:tryptophan synthase beta chain
MKRKMGKTAHRGRDGRGAARRGHGHRRGLLGMECVVYMGTVDMARQQPNVYRMQLLGTEVRG